MDCLHCGKDFHDQWASAQLSYDPPIHPIYWQVSTTVCPACKNIIVKLHKRQNIAGGGNQLLEEFIAYPKVVYHKPTPIEVPPEIKKDYEEAWAVLPTSENASAALSRRCLQAVLRGAGYSQHNLVQQIDAVLNEPDPSKSIPTGLRTTVDAIRNFGNFSAHQMTDQTTLQIIDVEPGEAEWCLEILGDMFDHYYVKPTQAAARKAALDAKLAAAGKPPSR